MDNLLLISPGLKNDSVFTSAINVKTCSVFYTTDMSINSVLNTNGISDVKKLAFVYHYPGYSEVPFFHDEKQLAYLTNRDTLPDSEATPIPEPYKQEYHYFSNNLVELFKKINELTNEPLIVDLLTCSLNSSDFKESVEKIEQDLGINIRYSLDQTGNEPEGNWVLESDGTDVKDVYFTDAINEWSGVLTNDRTINAMAGVTGFYLSGSTLFLNQDIVWTEVMNNTDFIALELNQVFDGQGFTIDMTGVTTAGLFSCSTTEGSPSIIKNLGVLNGTTATQGGFIVRKEQEYFKVENCYSTGVIGLQSGGICGNQAAGVNGEPAIGRSQKRMDQHR